ncbi:MAG TPA: hypothetical protein VGB24_09420 [Longimicrobium sp.]|jgi:hypothetical protein|uniref:hypothetical protein n=1 Tax=Longimicrobium sp. TaxID=2029185 RepID=UPI002ED98993
MMTTRLIRRLAGMAALAALSLSAACERNPALSAGDHLAAVVVNSVDNTLSIVPLEEGGTARTVGLAQAASSPVDLAVRGNVAVVPLGVYPFAAVVDLAAGVVSYRVSLPANSGATGVAFVNDSVALVANPGRNTVSPVNVRRGQAGAEIAVGVYPQAIVAGNGATFVINSNLVNFAPAGPGSVTVLNPALGVQKTIPLSGVNPAAGAVLGDRLYVLHSGNFGQANGSLSVVNLQTLAEESHHTGFGVFPTSLEALGNPSVLYVGGFGYGIAAWNPATRQFLVPPATALKPNGIADVGDMTVDDEGQLFFTAPGNCTQPGNLYLVGSSGAIAGQATVGVCPLGVELARIKS